VTTSSAECTLPPESASVAAARRFVEATCEDWHCEPAGWTATQLVSELATNAVLHARTVFTVQMHRDGEVLRVGVRDGSTVAPKVRGYGSESTTGRGLRLVESLSRAWGVEHSGDGKAVWFEVPSDVEQDVRTWDEADDDLDALLGRFAEPVDGPGSQARVPSAPPAVPRAA
jgi:anti-sigma regulatory factor (Ser/Thr protein kinase)